MVKSIFTPFQRQIFLLISQNSFIIKNYYFTGGTALSEFYLKHRYSEDFDFFSFKDVTFSVIRKNLEKDLKKAKVTLLDYQYEKEAKIFILRKKGKELVKIQFSYWPFKPIEKPIKKGRLTIDSLIDITVGKLEAIITRNRARDFVDFYFIQKEKQYPLGYLLTCLKKKYYWPVDPFFLGSQFYKVKDLVDYPKMIKKLDQKDLVNYFLKLAKENKKAIFVE